MTAANHLSQNMNATRVLVTGATGFIGKPLLKLLVERGFQVHKLWCVHKRKTLWHKSIIMFVER
ncbi:MAG: NAD-dependent epimerase/dehydratase family protein [Candidatus Oxydemutatoraceae bacterium WSBS_2016_MAG_OTU14]